MFSQGGPRPLHQLVPARRAVYEIQISGGRRWWTAGMCASSGGGGGGQASRAAAWVWHMHPSSSSSSSSRSTGRQPDYSSAWKMKRRSSSFERSDSRFRQEAAAATAPRPAAALPSPCKPPAAAAAAPLQPAMAAPAVSVWDCSSELYDTFELVSFTNSLDRNMLGGAVLGLSHGRSTASAAVPAPPSPSSAALPPSPSSSRRDFAGGLRTPISHFSDADPPPDRNSNDEIRHGSPPADLQRSSFTGRPFAGSHPRICPESVTVRWALSKLAHSVKRLARVYTQLECLGDACSSFRRSGDGDGGTGMPIPQRPSHVSSRGNSLQGGRGDGEEDKTGDGGDQDFVKVKWRKGVKHYYHHHHHYHHHFVHHVDQSNQTTNECKLCKFPLTIDVISCQ